MIKIVAMLRLHFMVRRVLHVLLVVVAMVAVMLVVVAMMHWSGILVSCAFFRAGNASCQKSAHCNGSDQ